MMIGFSLTADGLGFHIPKGYLYAAIGFSILIEVFNQIARSRRKRSLKGHLPRRERMAHAVLRLLGGRKPGVEEVGEDIVDMLEGDSEEPVFDRRERVMISGVLQLAQKPIRSVMTARTDVDMIDLDDDEAVIRQRLVASSYSRLPLIRGGRVEEPLGFVHKKELLNVLLTGSSPSLEHLTRTTINLLDSFSILNALDQMRAESTHIAFVVNEFGDFVGILSMTDILESIAGELPDASEADGPDLVEEGDSVQVNAAMNLTHLRERIGFKAPVTDEYQTLAGLIMRLLDRLPASGDEVILDGWSLKVVRVQERRVTRVLMRRL
jgi:CBS domain containing-hemolysin-like protein